MSSRYETVERTAKSMGRCQSPLALGEGTSIPHVQSCLDFELDDAFRYYIICAVLLHHLGNFLRINTSLLTSL
jgi:hypothetical protein